jgi:hypothetical protein
MNLMIKRAERFYVLQLSFTVNQRLLAGTLLSNARGMAILYGPSLTAVRD